MRFYGAVKMGVNLAGNQLLLHGLKTGVVHRMEKCTVRNQRTDPGKPELGLESQTPPLPCHQDQLLLPP